MPLASQLLAVEPRFPLWHSRGEPPPKRRHMLVEFLLYCDKIDSLKVPR